LVKRVEIETIVKVVEKLELYLALVLCHSSFLLGHPLLLGFLSARFIHFFISYKEEILCVERSKLAIMRSGRDNRLFCLLVGEDNDQIPAL